MEYTANLNYPTASNLLRQVNVYQRNLTDGGDRYSLTSGASNTHRTNQPDRIDTHDTLSETSKNKRLWQSLVIPLVLSCVLLMVILWSRQASLVFLKDTLFMLFILGSIFVIMSAIAFWLAQDREAIGMSSHEQIIECEHGGSASEIPSHFGTNTRCASNLSDTTIDYQNQCQKCYRLAIIDPHPPQYYAALQNSIPIEMLFNNHQIKPESNTSRSSEDDNGSTHSPPPSYDQLNKFIMGTDMNTIE